jgi:hypothetical protein
VVETPADQLMIEQTLTYKGLYFVLMGRLSPLDGIGPRDIHLEKLVARAADGLVTEVVLATNFTNEGEATAHYISEMLKARGLRSAVWRAACRWAANSNTSTRAPSPAPCWIEGRHDDEEHFRPAGRHQGTGTGHADRGPFCARMLAEFGAEVIKVESPDGGDPIRKWRVLKDGTSLWWSVQARNKKSLTLNMKHAQGREIARKLALEADIIIENYRPGVLEKWELGYEQLKALDPSTIMVRLSGFGQTGPMKDLPGFGAIGESMGGCATCPAMPTVRRCASACRSAIRSPRCTA